MFLLVSKHVWPRMQAVLQHHEPLQSGSRGADGGTSLVIKGSVGAIIGTPAAKEALADALLAAAAHVSDSDSETLVILLRLVEATLAAGLHEYTVCDLSTGPGHDPVDDDTSSGNRERSRPVYRLHLVSCCHDRAPCSSPLVAT